jgi:hypothetical protein
MDAGYKLIMSLLASVFTIIVAIQGFAHTIMNRAGVSAQIQSVTLLVIGVVCIIAALRAVGGLFGLLIVAFVVMFLIQVMVPGFTENFRPQAG